MIGERMKRALDEQINKELYSAYFYLGMSAYAASAGLKGFAGWFYKQWGEEVFHAKKIFDYVHDNGHRVTLRAIDNPPQNFTSGRDIFEKTLAHEKKVTAMINDLVNLAKKENDKDTEEFLQWFVKEQKEEEATPAAILRKIEQVQAEKKDLSEIDSTLAARK